MILSSSDEKNVNKNFLKSFKESPLPDDEILANLGLFLSSKSLARILFFYKIYKKILHSHGIVIEFGVRWGQTLSVLSALRGIFEPFNRHRKILGFDTFEGFKGMSAEDGERSNCREGSYSVSRNYEEYLSGIMTFQEQLNPMSHIRRFELIKGDAAVTVPQYLEKHPETIISMAVFDFDIYKPTKAALSAIKPYLAKGSILVFDELCDDIFPGETTAFKEVFALRDFKIKRFPFAARISYLEL
ncbi:MAG TPA: crotonobetainyl-CoA--carnitine CoA-transferase [Spirochaetia bacterium]|nr:crotonobetainyl-CoA--carnitine CoA-transferase [Spirochaetia bacterium]